METLVNQDGVTLSTEVTVTLGADPIYCGSEGEITVERSAKGGLPVLIVRVTGRGAHPDGARLRAEEMAEKLLDAVVRITNACPTPQVEFRDLTDEELVSRAARDPNGHREAVELRRRRDAAARI